MITINVSPSWVSIRGAIEPVRLNDLIQAAPEPPFRAAERSQPLDYLKTNAANLLYLESALPDAEWHDPHNRLFEAKAYRFLDKIRSAEPGDYETSWPFKLPPDPWQLKIFTHARLMKEMALAPVCLGAGKSKMILDIAADKFLRGEIDGLIVIAPNGVHRQWINEAIPTHMSDSVPTRCHIWKPTTKIPKEWPINPKESLKRLRVMAFNVEAFSTASGKAMKLLRVILQTGRFMVAMDESTRIKNGTTTRTRVLTRYIGPLAQVRAILTGTPVTKGLEDFYSQFNFLNPDIVGLSSYTAFRNRYCVTIPAYRGAGLGQVKIVGYKNQEELFRKMAPTTFMVGTEVLGLGDPLREHREVTLTPDQEAVYWPMAERLYEDLRAQRIATPQNTLVELLRLQQVLCGWVHETVLDEDGLETLVGRPIASNRIAALRNALDDIDGQAVVWARFTSDIDAIGAMMQKQDDAAQREGKLRRWRHVRYDGTVKAAVRDRGKEQFRDGEVEYFNGNPAAGGTGVDGLQQRCSMAVYFSNSFNREHRWQSEGRIYRRGQKERVGFLDLIVPGTVDELFLSAYAATEDLAKLVMKSPIMLRGGR